MKAEAMEAGTLVRELFRRFREADPSVADLFAEDGVLIERGERFEGREAVREFYRGVFELKPQPHVEALFFDLPTVAALLRVEAGNLAMTAIDVLTLVDGEVQSYIVCMAEDRL
jgi:uncharacterized protein (TIGR02246 family)